MPGHVGTCYQSTGARHVGRSRPRTLLFDTEGRVVSERALTKLRNDETGAKYAYAQLTAAGAPRRRMGESARDYVDRATKEGPLHLGQPQRAQARPGALPAGAGVPQSMEHPCFPAAALTRLLDSAASCLQGCLA